MNDHQSSTAFQPEDMPVDVLPIIIGGETVLVKSAEIKEVIRPSPLTAVPMGPKHLLGLANIRGQIVCIIDLGRLSSLPSINREITTRSRFIILRHPGMNIGIWADEVRATQHISCDEAALPDESEQTPGPVVTIEHQGHTQHMLNGTKLFH